VKINSSIPRQLPLSIRSLLPQREKAPAANAAPPAASGLAISKASSDVADIYFALAQPNSETQRQMAMAVKARQTEPAAPSQLTSLSDLVGKLYDLGD
jgi:hypothetical protein